MTTSAVANAYLGQKRGVRQAGALAGTNSLGVLADAILLRTAFANITNPIVAVPCAAAWGVHNLIQGSVVKPAFEEKVAEVGRTGRQNLWKLFMQASSRHRSRNERESVDVLFDHVEKINTGWRNHVPWLISDSLTIVATVAGSAILGGPLLALGLGAAVAASVAKGRSAMQKSKKLDREQHLAAVNMREATDPRALDLMRSLGRSDVALDRVNGAAEREARADVAASKPHHSVSRWTNAAEVVFNAGVLGLMLFTGSWFLAVAPLLAHQAFSAANRVPRNMLAIGPAVHAKNEFDKFLEKPPAIVEKPSAVDLPRKLRHGISFEDVNFGYGDGESFLQKVSFTARAGEVTTLVGLNAAGKSTLLELAQRNEVPRLGAVKFDGIDVRDAKVDSVSRLTTPSMQQQSYVITGTLRENLLLVRPQATDRELERVCAISGLSDWLVRSGSPLGLDTPTSNDSLSGGTRQRVAIARLLLNPPAVALLDEPTAALDPSSRDIVLLAVINELRRAGSTVILVTHDAAAARHSDRVVLLEDGVVKEQGRSSELLGRESELNRFFDRDPDRAGTARAPGSPSLFWTDARSSTPAAADRTLVGGNTIGRDTFDGDFGLDHELVPMGRS